MPPTRTSRSCNNNLLPFEGIRSNTAGGIETFSLTGSALALTDFNGYDGTTEVFGIRVADSRRFDPSVVALAAVPEPASLALVGVGGLLIATRHRRA